jgi:hypothetical protein
MAHRLIDYKEKMSEQWLEKKNNNKMKVKGKVQRILLQQKNK